MLVIGLGAESALTRRLVVGALMFLSACHKQPEPPPAELPQSAGEESPGPGPACGKVTCAAGEVCCNPSCSICAAPDGMCTQQFCEADVPADVPRGGPSDSPPPGETPPASEAVEGSPEAAPGMSCDNVRCMAGTHCEMVQVQCVRAPCDPVPECRPDTPAAAGVSCGKSTCAPGQSCCNPSCGIGTDPGQGCIKMLCPDGELPRSREP